MLMAFSFYTRCKRPEQVPLTTIAKEKSVHLYDFEFSHTLLVCDLATFLPWVALRSRFCWALAPYGEIIS